MARIQLPPEPDLTDAQRRVCEAAIASRRGHVPAPLTAWLSSPEFAGRAQHLGEFVRYQTSLTPRLSELAILLTAHYWQAQYEWSVHKAEALKAGLEPAVVDAIAQSRRPAFTSAKEEIVYDLTRGVHEIHQVNKELYQRAVDALGERGVVELVGIIGYYSLVAMTLNVFEIGIPDGPQEPE
jgi:4-carboxymuconolactone decarboxylase